MQNVWIYSSRFQVWWKTQIWEWSIEQAAYDLGATKYNYAFYILTKIYCDVEV